MENNRGFCAQECAISECVSPPEALHPLLPAEQVCIRALEVTEPRRKIARASSLIEQAINKHDSSLLNSAAVYLEHAKEDKLQCYKAFVFDAYMPLFQARIERREASNEELTEAFALLHFGINQSMNLIKMDANTLSLFLNRRNDPDSIKFTRNFIVGAVNEAIIPYLSLYNAMENGGDILYPSSLREDNPPYREISDIYEEYLNDCHTFSPTNPNERKIFSIKSKNYKGQKKNKTTGEIVDEVATRLSPIELGNKVNRELRKHNRELDTADILDIIVSSEDTSKADYSFYVEFRRRMAYKLQETIYNTECIYLEDWI